MKVPVYLDNNGSTMPDPNVLALAMDWAGRLYGNPSNVTHAITRICSERLDQARDDIRMLLNAPNHEVMFASSATEVINTVIQSSDSRFICYGATEHSAVSETCRWLQRHRNTRVATFRVLANGRADLEDLNAKLGEHPDLVVAMYANNETGVLHPIPEISTLARCAGAAVFCDASQVPGRVALDVLDLGIDAVVISGHKIHGIRGAAALAYDARTTPRLRPLLFGGGHEFGLRAGTENTPAIVALVEALRIAVSSLPGQAAFLYQLREEFEHRLSESVEGITWLGDPVQRLPNTSSFCLTARRVPDVLARCKDLVVSTGSACGSDGGRPSPVLLAMGVPRTAALNSIRVSFGRFNTQSDAHFAADTLSKAIRKTPLIE